MTMYATSVDQIRAARTVVRRSLQSSERWLYLFLIFQFVCQSALMAEWLGGRWRLFFRAATFASSLLMLAFLPGKVVKRHPARPMALALLGIMGLGLLHPYANTLSGIAHWLLNIAIWAPLFWIGRIALSPRALWNVFMMLWLFNVASAVMGVLQIYYPERFAPSAEFVRNLLGSMADGMLISLSDGRQVWRPCGLSDSPGGAAAAGSFAMIVGMFLLTTKPNLPTRIAAIIGIVAGSFCIYICEIRSVMLTTVLGVAVMVGLQVLQGRLSRAAASAFLIPLVIAGGFSWSMSVSGGRVGKRISTLTASSASNVYYMNRGMFIEHSLTEDLPRYPLGAGLGRYGMMFAYFGDPTIANSQPLWVEVQLTAWLYDGGLLLVLLGYAAVTTACVVTFQISLNRQMPKTVSDTAAILSALNAGWLAITFNYPLFLGQGGLVFWVANASLYGAAVSAGYGRLNVRGVPRR